MICPQCGSADTRRATVYWQCSTCDNEWQASEHDEWREKIRRVLEGASGGPARARHTITEEQYRQLHELDAPAHLVAWWLITGRPLGVVREVLEEVPR